MSSEVILAIIGIAAGASVSGLSVVYPQSGSLLLFGGTAISLILAVFVAIKRGRSMIKMKDCSATNCNTAIKMQGSAQLDCDGFTSIGNHTLLDMSDQAKAKMRNIYHEYLQENLPRDHAMGESIRSRGSSKGWNPRFRMPWIK